MNRRLRLELAFILGSAILGARAVNAQVRKPKESSRLPTRRGLSATALTLIGGAAAIALWPTERYSFRGKSAVITGGSRGLGLAIARELLREGARVTLLARNPDELERACKLLDRATVGASGHVFTVVCDVTNPQQVENALAEARARFGGIDLLFNNAGSITVGPFASLNQADFDAQLNLHVRAPLITTLAVRPYFHIRGGGRIVNISSIGGRIAIPHMAPYCASKFALGGLSETLRSELSLENITVTTVYPGLMRTGSPMQAVFKGDRDREFAWFATGDVIPGLSIDAAQAAQRILDGVRHGSAEVVVSVPAKLAIFFRALFPETYALATEVTARLMPKHPEDHAKAQERTTGAASLASLSRFVLGRWVRFENQKAAHRWNERPSYDADFNLGVHPV
jgi:NAD(P)-dependent dehydrogenase (short-subunit alcohol dehydrogenase family)